ncbi:acyltransferase [Flavobacterium sp. CYK-55]|uniref:acyltransferase family protein n=1 Tax=Flavobacterium sp. CYK-55 TaxID=2835529 RepID=UPI001BCB7C6B|nr:acyltransferase [Flavobacterium sp. CYK-55]MBS7787245.1 acyltransferase [Flavobacterium sp. CYK-55]
MKLKYYHNLDGFRAIAAFGVVIAHFFTLERLGGLSSLFALAQQGNSGVSLFFVLSGFVITRILLQSVNSPRYFINFYGRRTLRIFPLYYLALCCYVFIPALLHWVSTFPPISESWYHFAYLQNFARTFNWPSQGPGHYWSLAVEEHFYLIWPAVVYACRGKYQEKLLAVSIGFIAMAAALRWLMFSRGMDINVFTFTRLDQLSMGCILAILESRGWLEKAGRDKTFLGLMFLGILSIGICSRGSELMMNVTKHLAYGLLYFGLIGYAITTTSNHLMNRFLNHSVMQYLGKISYGLYVWHVLVLMFFEHYVTPGNSLIDFIMVSVVSVAVSALSWHFYEKRFLSLKRYFEH